MKTVLRTKFCPARWLAVRLLLGGAALAAGCGGGNSSTLGPAGAGGSGGNAGRGGATPGMPGGRGGQPSGGSGGARATAPGGNGTGGASMPGGITGGSSAKVVCPPGMTYGNPLPPNIVVEQIGAPPADYFAFIEGPVWIGSLDTLFFSDNASSPQERIFELIPPALTPQLFMESSASNGLAVDNNDKLVVADERNQRITRVDPATGVTLDVIVPAGNFKPNDVIVRSDDNIYFTDPDSGFYRVSPGGLLSAPAKLLVRPNGIALSLDESSLYVADQGNKQIHRFRLATDGTVDLASDMIFATAMHDTADGMCVDCGGNVYIATGGGVEAFAAASGTYLGLVPTGEASNCTFGGVDRRTMYVTSRALLETATLNVPGLPD